MHSLSLTMLRCGALIPCLLLQLSTLLPAQTRLPKQNVVDVAATCEGLCVHNAFQSNMVLQRDKPIRIRGWAEAGEGVRVVFGNAAAETIAGADRSWTVTLAPQPANARPGALQISGQNATITLENILVGDVWVLGGQSNMEFPLERVDNGWLEIVSANYDQIRILTVPAPNDAAVHTNFERLHEWSDWFGRHFRKGDWDVCRPAIAEELSAIGYVFARRIHMASQVPIGVIDVSRGGTTVEAWTPEAVLREIDATEVRALLAGWDERIASWDAEADLARRQRDYAKRCADLQARGEAIPSDWSAPTDLKPGPAADQNRPGACYNCMLTPLAGLAVKGVIFHQGYNNANGGTAGAAMYYQIFGRMIRAWRAAFEDPALPFGIIALCTDGTPQTLENYCEMMLDDGIYIREAQYQTFLDLAAAGDMNIGFASSYDMRRGWYHPQLKIPVGERIARWALATQYGLASKIRWKPPTILRMEIVGSTVVLHMDCDVSAADNSAAIEGFSIAGEDRCFHPARAEWQTTTSERDNRPQRNRKVLVLSSSQVSSPLHFRYAFGRNPMGNLQSADHNDLPLATQRSDRWKIEEVPLGVLGADVVKDGSLNRQQRARIRDVLKAQDLARRLAEARALLDAHGASSNPPAKRD